MKALLWCSGRWRSNQLNMSNRGSLKHSQCYINAMCFMLHTKCSHGLLFCFKKTTLWNPYTNLFYGKLNISHNYISFTGLATKPFICLNIYCALSDRFSLNILMLGSCQSKIFQSFIYSTASKFTLVITESTYIWKYFLSHLTNYYKISIFA